jgi:hypothetical protein
VQGKRTGHKTVVFGQILEIRQRFVRLAQLHQGVDNLDMVYEIMALRPEQSRQFPAHFVAHRFSSRQAVF